MDWNDFGNMFAAWVFCAGLGTVIGYVVSTLLTIYRRER